MKATQLLVEQHSQVKQLMKQIKQSGPEDRAPLCQQLGTMLRAHNLIEEELLYPRFESEKGFEQLIQRSFQEHQQATMALGDFERCPPDDPQLDGLLAKLEQLVLAHVKLEESQTLPKIKALWTEEMLDNLGTQMQERFDQICEEEQPQPTV